MKTAQLLNYERDRWIAGEGDLADLPSAIDGSLVARIGSGGLDFGAMLRRHIEMRHHAFFGKQNPAIRLVHGHQVFGQAVAGKAAVDLGGGQVLVGQVKLAAAG